MPRRHDIQKILIIGSGPIVIGQACEFDYSGTQGCKALREDGYEVVIVNSNPATIMTDPQFGDRTYIEPLTAEVVEAIIERERPHAILPTLGGQTALNLAMELSQRGTLERYGCRLIGANAESIARAEDRQQFKNAMIGTGLDVPRSAVLRAGGAREQQILRAACEALERAQQIGFPVIIRPSFTLGGTGGGIVYNVQEFPEIAQRGLSLSPIHEIMIEESVLGWKEYELEVMRDMRDNVVVICPIENFDPMGAHTGDSITVAPIQTLTDREYQAMRDDALKIIRAIGVDTGGSNIQFAVDPRTGRRVVIEMNPRVSRSSALASKATGFPIARIAAKLATGMLLDELPNDITKKTPACFEPTIDYCVVKVPRFAFEKFPGAEALIGTQMKSVGETMAIGRTFKEALQKGLRGLETGRAGLGGDGKSNYDPTLDDAGTRLLWRLRNPNPDRIFWVRAALRGRVKGARGKNEVFGEDAIDGTEEHESGKSRNALMSVNEVFENTKIDPWFLENIREICDFEHQIAAGGARKLIRKRGTANTSAAAEHALLLRAKQLGFSDFQIACLASTKRNKLTEWDIRARRLELGIRAVFKSVDTCGGEFEAQTPYYYSTYEDAANPLANEAAPTNRRKVIILGGGPNRIGQGIEFDYCCVQAVFALKQAGYETIMVNSNPETVSTDYDTADRLYFEPLTAEDVLNIVENECGCGEVAGIIVQFGGQTPLKLARALEKYIAENNLPAHIVGTSPDSIDLAEDRERFGALLDRLQIPSPPNGSGRRYNEVRELARRIGYPVMVRPSYVLGGRAMEIVYNERQLREFMKIAIEVSPEHPILVDKFLDGAIEVDVDAICDYTPEIPEAGSDVRDSAPPKVRCVIAAIMEHIEEAGIHSGDSACVIPTRTLPDKVLSDIRRHTRTLGQALRVRGLMNIQYAVKDETVFVLEVNPRASRTVPYVSKTIGKPIARYAARVMLGSSLDELGFTNEPAIDFYSVKEAVLPFNKFPGCDIRLGPEMRSTGEVMGIDPDAGLAFAKSQSAAGASLPLSGGVFISINDTDKPKFAPIATQFASMGFYFYCTGGTHKFLQKNEIASAPLNKIKEGRPNIIDYVINGQIQLVINTFSGPQGRPDEKAIRTLVVQRGIPLLTTISAARAAVEGIAAMRAHKATLRCIQEYHAEN
ncbi:MAG: carbamoyl-phosphate synthase large subunit [bacterium]|nr:carbamoyl-phosphate synthase large subunit [Candidatus Sumerlaeota bacterium]